jgi:hypothetical protein
MASDACPEPNISSQKCGKAWEGAFASTVTGMGVGCASEAVPERSVAMVRIESFSWRKRSVIGQD